MTKSSTHQVSVWHSLSSEDVCKAFFTNESGLTEQEAEKRLKISGFNKLTPIAASSSLKRFLLQFHNVLIYLLIIAAAITFVIGEKIDSMVIMGVVLINAIIGYIQEGKAEKALDSIRNLLTPEAKVRRERKEYSISSEQLVPGDIVALESGDKVPADLRLLQAKNLRIDESMLTGESLPVEKYTLPVALNSVLAERVNTAYSGTLVTYGTALGIVVATGDTTEIGRINQLLNAVSPLVTPLLRQIAEFSRWLTVLILAVSAITFFYGWSIEHSSPTELFLSVVSLAVAAIPEGLPAIMTITLAIGVQLMAKQNAIIRRLPAVETLGSVTVICTDKTGTLTCNEMTVKSIIAGNVHFTVEGAGYDPNHGVIKSEGKPIDLEQYPDLKRLIKVSAICNNASISQSDGIWVNQGDPTEAALITLAMKAGIFVEPLKSVFNRTDNIPFESAYSFMATLHQQKETGFLLVKGAPEKVISRCRYQQKRGLIVPLDVAECQLQINKLATCGQRLLAVAMKEMPSAQSDLNFEDVDAELIFLGMVGMIDPPRPEALDAVKQCQDAGIRVIMITGDHAVTALSIAEQMSIGKGSVLRGDELDLLSDSELEKKVRSVDVFARATPENKIRLVKALQSHHQIVAMTGDGVNDAPALKSADVGIAMGKKGTEVAKDASEIVLADDNFATIAKAVETGRGVYDNLKKAFIYILPTSIAEALMIVVATLTGNILPITPVQILWINMITETTLSLTLAFETPERKVMNRPPRKPDEPLLSKFLIWRIIFVSIVMVGGTYGLFLWQQSHSTIAAARTVAVNTLVMFEIFYVFNSRYLLQSVVSIHGIFGNWLIWIAVAVLLIAQSALTYWPVMQALFDTASLDAQTWVIITLVGFSLFVLVEIEKFILRIFM
ncbi:MAG: cation-transporting P-type ATPase [Methylococcaceae bacterium]|nr:cation-transporting P-type ATPase [Methylococcaceae bacterium]